MAPRSFAPSETSTQASPAVFTTPGVDRVFIACLSCGRVRPHYRAYAFRPKTRDEAFCKCGGQHFRPVRLPEWKAAWWVLVVGWLWRKTLRREAQWDPRMPIQQR